MGFSAALRGRERLPAAWPVQEPPGPPSEAGRQQRKAVSHAVKCNCEIPRHAASWTQRVNVGLKSNEQNSEN